MSETNSGGGVETVHIDMETNSDDAWYTNANFEIKSAQIDFDLGVVAINDDVPIGTLIYTALQPMNTPSSITLIIGSATQGYLYKVTG